MISFEQALQSVLQQADLELGTETVALRDALARRLSGDVHADTDWPVTDRSAMDGFGVRASDTGIAAGTRLRLVGESLAGQPFLGRVGPGEAIRIMTGAVVPADVDAVVPVEASSGFTTSGFTASGFAGSGFAGSGFAGGGGVAGGDSAGVVTIHMQANRGDHIRRRGSEVRCGDRLLARGTKIGPAEIGALAVLGLDPVPVLRRPVLAILATGDEVVPVHETPLPHQVRNSNAHALAAQVRVAGGEVLDLGIAGDDAASLRQAILAGLQQADALLSIGGVSKGTHDLVHRLYAELGIETVFHGVAFKPGKPTFFGRTTAGRSCLVFGLPGNPASCFTVFDLLVKPWLVRVFDPGCVPRTTRVRLGGEPFRQNARLQAIPTALQVQADATVVALLSPSRPSGDPFGLLGAEGYALIAAEQSPRDTSMVNVVMTLD